MKKTDFYPAISRNSEKNVDGLKTSDLTLNLVEGGLRLQGAGKRSLPKMPLISVITVVYNGVDYIDETILSVIDQSYENIEYIIIDGGSDDGTVERIRKYNDYIDYWISESDSGMYDAIVKGFTLVNGEIVCYLNAGDYYHHNALAVVAEIFDSYDVEWLAGMRVNYNEKSQVIHVDLPSVYRKELVRAGVYGKFLPYIQQESVFWRKSLLDLVDYGYLKKMKLAGDYYLWYCFAKSTDLNIVNSYLGGFKYHANQLSSSIEKYNGEKLLFVESPRLYHFPVIMLEAVFWFLPVRLKILFSKKYFIYSRERQMWVRG